MSKIIKARFVVNDKRKTGKIKETGTMNETNSEYLNKETADALYLETKIMLQELVIQAQQKADEIILKAKEEAQFELENSRRQSQEIKDAAYKEGFEQGQRKGLEEAEESVKNQYKDLIALIESIKEEKEEFFRKQETEMIELVMALSEKIVGTVFETRPEVINYVVKNTLEQVKGNGRIIVKVNPMHIPYLTGNEEYFKDLAEEKLIINEDPNIKPGDCQVITENGFVDSILAEQLEEIKQALMEVVEDDQV